MKKNDFLEDPKTRKFIEYFSQELSGDKINAALESYRWPTRRIDIPTPEGVMVIHANSSFEENRIVLDKLEAGIRHAFHNSKNSLSLSDWAQAIMVWGGVYTRRGNAAWLDHSRTKFYCYLKQALTVLSQDDDQSPVQMMDLRSNAGTTKIYSLLLPNFVIYDSRVAAALAWLVFQWAGQNPLAIPEHLRFACMRANSMKPKARSPCPDIFRYFSASGKKHHHHAMWNLRANWIIEAATKACPAHRKQRKVESRDVEAALFMIGDNLSLNP